MSPQDPESVILEQFRFEAQRLGEDFTRASALGAGTPSEVSDRTEIAFRRLIARFFPAPHHVTKGQILATSGVKSASIDCVVLSPAHPNLVDSEGKFMLLLADGVDFAIDIKGRLDREELLRFLVQARTVKRCLRSESPTVALRSTPELVEAGKRIPTYAYCARTSSTVETLASQYVELIAELGAGLSEHPDVIAIHDRGYFLDTCNVRSPGGTLFNWLPNQLLWVEAGDMTLGHFLVLLNMGAAAQMSIASPILNRYVPQLRINANQVAQFDATTEPAAAPQAEESGSGQLSDGQ